MEIKRLVTQQKHDDKPKVTHFSIKNVMKRFDTRRETSISDLRREVNFLKEEIREVKARLQKIFIDALTKQVLKRVNLPEESKYFSSEDMKNNDERDPGINVISRVKPPINHILIKLVIINDLILKKVALFDIGADRNLIVKGHLPTKYLQKET